MKLQRAVGKQIGAVRRGRKLTQEQLAEKADRAIGSIQAIEQGRAAPSLRMLEVLSKVLRVPVGRFFDFDDSYRDEPPARLRTLADLAETARQLDDADLQIALDQIKAFVKRRRKRA